MTAVAWIQAPSVLRAELMRRKGMFRPELLEQGKLEARELQDIASVEALLLIVEDALTFKNAKPLETRLQLLRNELLDDLALLRG